jgi:hypothetical protein
VWGVWLDRGGVGVFDGLGGVGYGPAIAYTREMAARVSSLSAARASEMWSPGVAHSVRRIPDDVPSHVAHAFDVAIVGVPRVRL